MTERYVWASCSLLHDSNCMSKIIWKQLYQLDMWRTHPEVTKLWARETLLMGGREGYRGWGEAMGVGWGELNWSWEPGFGKSLTQGSPSQSVTLFKCYDGGSGHLCARAVAMLCESEVTASTFRHLSAFSCSETIEGGLGSFAPTLFNLIVKYKRQFPHIESYLGLSAHSHLSPLN